LASWASTSQMTQPHFVQPFFNLLSAIYKIIDPLQKQGEVKRGALVFFFFSF